MCEKCTELDSKIAQYRWFTTYRFDSLTTSRIESLIEELQRTRDAMHADDQPPAE